ncbi:MAG: hypothetical protein ABL964_15170 [Steroidobacteraceae bacterium]
MKSVSGRPVLVSLVLAALAVFGGSGLHADPLPAGWQASNVRPVGFLNIPGPRTFKLGLKPHDGRWYLFVASGQGGPVSLDRPDTGFTVVDVTDPAKPRLVKQVFVSRGAGQLTLHDNLLIAGQQMPQPALDAPDSVLRQRNDMATFFDISNPENPVKLSTWNTEGWGTHRNGYPGGRYAFMSALVPGFRGNTTILVILDVSNPQAPREVGRWWRPGHATNEPPASMLFGHHGPGFLQPDGKTLTVGYVPGVTNLDISDPAHPKVVGELLFSPLPDLGQQALHTASPLPNGHLTVSTEPRSQGCDSESPAFAAVVDNRDLANPKLVSFYPRPTPPKNAPYRSFCEKEGRFGPHNVNTEFHEEGVEPPSSRVFMTYFNAGMRVYDVSDTHFPTEIGWFLPKMGAWKDGARGLEDVLVDTRGFAYVTDGLQGLWIVRFTGSEPPKAR